jgi:superfamily II DNA/RNA helicase
VGGLSMMLRLFAGNPKALMFSPSKLAQMLTSELASQLPGCSSAKTEELFDQLDRIVTGQDDKAMVFTFYAHTVLPVLRRELARRYSHVFVYDGGRGSEEAKSSFRQHRGGAILLCSDAASDGINVPEAAYIIEYEPARTHATRTQRFGRGHRLGRERPLTGLTLCLDGTVDQENTMETVLKRNEQQDIFLGDEGAAGYTSAADRREMFTIARRRKAL